MPGPHNGGPHSGWPYPTSDPNPTEDEVDLEAAMAYLKLKRGMRADDICRELNLSRRTFYRRVESLILAQDRPSRRLMQALEHDRQEDLLCRTHELLDGEVSNADAARLLTVAASIGRDKRRMFALDEAPEAGADVGPDEPEVTEWVAAEHEESENELRRVRNGDGHSG